MLFDDSLSTETRRQEKAIAKQREEDANAETEAIVLETSLMSLSDDEANQQRDQNRLRERISKIQIKNAKKRKKRNSNQRKR